MDMPQIASATGTMQALLEMAKRARELAKNVNNIELREMLVDLQDKALDTREENQKLRDKIVELEDKLRNRDAMNFDGNVYWHKEERNTGNPFCPTCFDKEEKKIHLHAQGGAHNLNPYWDCKVCGSIFPRK